MFKRVFQSKAISTRQSILTCILILLACLLTGGCSSTSQNSGDTKDTQVDFSSGQTSGQENSESDSAESAKTNGEADGEKSGQRPRKLTVLSVRSTALEGMKQEDIVRLKTAVASANLRLEADLIFGDLQDRLSDPEDAVWNYLHQTGEIIIGYAFENDILEQKDNLRLSRQEFERRYGQPVYARNDYDAGRILEVLNELKESIHNEKFRRNFDTISELIQKAAETHDVNYIINIYRILHDMDYYVLRYGPEDVGKYVQDKSTIKKYYGVLEDYMGTQYYNTDGFLT